MTDRALGAVCLLLAASALLAAARAEYVWDGYDWVWNEESDSAAGGDAGLDGSGDGDDDEPVRRLGSAENDDVDEGSGDAGDLEPDPEEEDAVDLAGAPDDDVYVESTGRESSGPTTAAPRDPAGGESEGERRASFFAKPGTLAAVVGGAVVGLLAAILCVMFVVYRMRKKDEGSYALDEPRRSPNVMYSKAQGREIYA